MCAVIQYSGLITQIKGKMRGAIFQSGAGGQIMRSAKNFNRKTSGTFAKAKFNTGTAARAWAGLTAAEQAAWQAQAANYMATTRFGEKRQPSGYHLFMKQNISSLRVTANIITTPKAPVGVSVYTMDNVFFSPGPLLFINSSGGINVDEAVIWEACPPFRNGKKPGNGQWKIINIEYGSAGSPTNMTVEYKAIFGALPPGAAIWVRQTVINQFTMQKGGSTFAFAIVP